MTTNSTGSDGNDGFSPYGVDVSCVAPPIGVPDAYLVQVTGSNPNSGLYQVISGTSFTDTNTGWGSSASYSALKWVGNLTWTAAPAPIDNYILRANYAAVTETWYNLGNITSFTDDYSGTTVAITVTPTASTKTAIFDASLNINASYTVATLPTGTLGDRTQVTDALAPTFLATLIGNGTVVCPAFFDGTNWIAA